MNKLESFPDIQPETKTKKLEAYKTENNLEQQEDLPDFKFEVTTHSVRDKNFNPEQFRKDCQKTRNDGIDKIRMDCDMKIWEQEGQDFLVRYKEAKQITEETGLEAPTVVLSNPSGEMIKLYNKDKEQFYSKFKEYANEVKEMLNQAGGQKVNRIQILNELNNKLFTKVKPRDITELVKITREVFHDYNPNLKLLATLNVNNLAGAVGTGAKKYMSEWKEVLNNFDIIGLDYYPGTWHFPGVFKKILKEKHLPTPKQFFKHWVKDVGLLKEVSEEVATWSKDYELDEVGMPSRAPWGGEKGQRYFYDSFIRGFKHMLNDFSRRGIKLPNQLGFYQMKDEDEPIGKFGLRTEEGEDKMITSGDHHLYELLKQGDLSDEETRVIKEQLANQPSRIKRLKGYLQTKQEKTRKGK